MKRVATLLVLAVALAGGLVWRAGAQAAPEANQMVVLLTDYGADDTYVGILKGAIMTANPRARLFDASHGVPNFDVAAASYMLGRIAPEWPAGTTFVVVVDPGVGTARRLIAVETREGRRFVAPDNGCLTDALARSQGWTAYELTNQRYRRPGTVSSTFHGRDWFGPVGGHLAGGLAIAQVGPQLDKLVLLPRETPRREGEQVVGSVVYVDHYGNLLTNLEADFLGAQGFGPERPIEIRVGEGNWIPVPWVGTYGEVAKGELLVTSHNAERGLEVAVSYGDAAERLKASAGMPLRLRPARETKD